MERIKLDLVPSCIKPVLHASQYDDGRQWTCDILNGGTPYVFQSGDTVDYTIRKGDGLLVTGAVAVTPGTSYIILVSTEQMCAVFGSNLGELTITSNGTKVGSVNFILEVERAPDENGITSQSEIKNLARQVHDIVVEELEDNGAEETGYDNTESGLEATNVQDAIDELANKPSVDAYTKEESDQKFATINSVPTKTSQLQNDNGFAQIDDASEANNKTWSAEKLDETFRDVDMSIDTIATYSRGKNLIDPQTLTSGAIQADGSIATASFWANYFTTDFIALEKNTSYAFAQYYKENGNENNGRRGYLLFDADKNIISDSYSNETSGPTVIANTNASYIRVFFQNSSNGQLEKGSVKTSYEPYTFTISLNNRTPLTDRMVLGVDNEVYKVLSVNNAKMTLQIVDNDMTITSGLLKRTYKRHSNVSNKCFSFMNAFLNDVKIKGCEDDITPLRLGLTGGVFGNWTVGANHGWVALRITGTALTQEDCGSIWTDGVRNYTLIKVGNGTAYFTYPASTDGYNTKIIAVDPVANLTHVSGATHTSTISISTASRQQLYPSISNNIVNIFADGKEITQDGTFEAYKIVVKETYNILDYVDIQNYMQNHIGANFDNVVNNIDSLLTLNFAYEIYDCGETVYTNLIAKKNVLLANCGFLQSEVIQAGSGTVYRYLNGVKTGSPFESETLIDMTNYNTSVDITSSDMIDSDKPSNRVVDVCKDLSGNILYGFTLGFIPDLSRGSDDKRKNLTNIWNMRNSKKTYPYVIVNENFDVNDYATVVGYRQYILPNQEITNRARVKLGNRSYYFIDAHSDFCINVDDSDIGNKVSALDNTDVVYSDVISSVGLSVSSEQSYSSATLKTD